MNILIFTAATGGEHRRTSQAMCEYFNHHVPGANVRTVDCLKEINKMVDKNMWYLTGKDAWNMKLQFIPLPFSVKMASTLESTA